MHLGQLLLALSRQSARRSTTSAPESQRAGTIDCSRSSTPLVPFRDTLSAYVPKIPKMPERFLGGNTYQTPVFRKRGGEAYQNLMGTGARPVQSLFSRVIEPLDGTIRMKNKLKAYHQSLTGCAIDSLLRKPGDFSPAKDRNKSERRQRWRQEKLRRCQGNDSRPLEKPLFRRSLPDTLK
jgi:hypothetical protein